jgi:hypothetical protein
MERTALDGFLLAAGSDLVRSSYPVHRQATLFAAPDVFAQQDRGGQSGQSTAPRLVLLRKGPRMVPAPIR